MQVYTANVDGDFNNRGFNVTAQYNFNFSPVNQFGAFARIGEVDYATEFNSKDMDQNLLGINWVHVFTGKARISMVMAAILGSDEAVESDSPYGRDFNGLRVSMAYPFTHRFNLFASVGSTDSDYDGTFFTDTENRSDSQTDFSIGSSWRASKNWLLRAVIARTDNTSNVDIFDYDRTQVMFTARSEFLP